MKKGQYGEYIAYPETIIKELILTRNSGKSTVERLKKLGKSENIETDIKNLNAKINSINKIIRVTQIQKIIIATRNLKAENGLASRHDVPIAFYAKKSSLKARVNKKAYEFIMNFMMSGFENFKFERVLEHISKNYKIN